MRVDEVEPCQRAFELDVLAWFIEAGAVMRGGGGDEAWQGEQSGNEERASRLSS